MPTAQPGVWPVMPALAKTATTLAGRREGGGVAGGALTPPPTTNVIGAAVGMGSLVAQGVPSARAMHPLATKIGGCARSRSVRARSDDDASIAAREAKPAPA